MYFFSRFQMYSFIAHTVVNHTSSFTDNLVKMSLNLQEFSDRNKSLIILSLNTAHTYNTQKEKVTLLAAKHFWNIQVNYSATSSALYLVVYCNLHDTFKKLPIKPTASIGCRLFGTICICMAEV